MSTLFLQVYLEGPRQDQFCIALDPVVSDPIYDKKLLSKLSITDISTNSTVAIGGKVMIFCNYIDEDDIEVVFFECDHSGAIVWRSLANTKPPYGEVHKRAGMSFTAPPYRDAGISRVVKCFMQLRRISDHETSEPIVFYYLPLKPVHNCTLHEMFSRARALPLNGYSKRCRNKQLANNDHKEARDHKPAVDQLIRSRELESDDSQSSGDSRDTTDVKRETNESESTMKTMKTMKTKSFAFCLNFRLKSF